MLGTADDWAGAIALHDRATAAGLTGSAIYAIDGGDHHSAIDPADAGLITRIAAFAG